MRIIKRTFLVLATTMVLFVAIAVTIPLIFESDIKEHLEQEIATVVNADVNFDIDNLNLTFFSNFPNITAEIEDLSVFNRAPFEGLLLFSLERLSVEVNLYTLLFESQMRLKGITLVRPRVQIQVLPSGEANYNITYPSTDTVVSMKEKPSSFSFQIDHWQIIDGDITYYDQSIPSKLVIKGLNHSGKGDFTEKVFDLETHTLSDTLSIMMGGTTYMSDKRLAMDITLSVSEEYTRFAFKENMVILNDFTLAFDGWFKMNEKNYDMDISYSTKENSFKTLLSLVPGIYTHVFKDIEATGNITFNGFINGIYDDKRVPAFNLGVEVNEGMFKYPDLPATIHNININLLVDNKDGIINNTRIDLSKLHLDFGKNPFDIKMIIENLTDYKMEGELKARLNLEEVSKILPMEELDMKGSLFVEATAKGIYDSVQKIMPTLNMTMALHDGYVKSKDLPLPLEKVNFDATVKNVSGKMADATAEIKNLSMLMDGEKFVADIIVKNMNDYTWDINALGTIDLEKITKIFPIEKMDLSGKVKADIHTKGKMSYITKKQYDRIPTQGEVFLDKFKFISEDLPHAITIDNAHIAFYPKTINLKSLTGTVGESDFKANGSLSNYLGYFFSSNETLNGKLSLKSNFLNLNEFMTSTAEEHSTTTEKSDSYSVITIPENINITLNASIKNMVMTDYNITNALGGVTMQGQVASLKNLTFDLLGSAFQVTGAYSTEDEKSPEYDMKLTIRHMELKQAFNSFAIVKTYAPIAGLATGNCDADFAVRGEILPDMTLDMATVTGGGVVKIVRIGITDSKIIAGVTALTKLIDSDEVWFEDAQIRATIEKGRLSVAPFDVQFGDYKTNVKGSVGMDGSIDYLLTIHVPVDKLGQQLQGISNKYIGNAFSEIPVTIGIGGTYDKPKFNLKIDEQKKQIQKAATNIIKEKGKEVLQKALQSDEAKQLINDVLNLANKNTKDTSKNKEIPIENLIQKGLQNLFKKKKD